jgi:hypothetical protein
MTLLFACAVFAAALFTLAAADFVHSAGRSHCSRCWRSYAVWPDARCTKCYRAARRARR